MTTLIKGTNGAFRICAGLRVGGKSALSICKRTATSASAVHTNNIAPNLVGHYDEVHRRSLENPNEFWAEIAENVVWTKKWSKVLENPTSPHAKWFVGGELNTCYNAVDKHVEAGRGDRVAIIHDSPITQSCTKLTFSELQVQVSKLAGAMAKMGVKKGDGVMIYMPMIPEAMVAMLACARLGAIHSLVFGGFASQELATRIDHQGPKIVLSANCGVEPKRVVDYKAILDKAIDFATHKPEHCIVYQRPNLEHVYMVNERDRDWTSTIDASTPHDCVPVDAQHPAYVLYTSGTTGSPKGILRPTGGHAVVLPWTMKAIYGMEKDDTWWAASDLGWIVGHSYICYAPLFNGNTTVIYEGKPVGTPDAGQFFRVIQDHNVSGMFTAPTAIRAIKQQDPGYECARQHDYSCLKYLYIAGEPLDHETRVWAGEAFKSPALDNWWQTETGFAISANCTGLGNSLDPPMHAGGKPFVGFDIQVLDKQGKNLPPGELGRIVCKLPLPPGTFSALFKAEDRFISTYFNEFPGYYDTSDAGMLDEEGYVYVMAREDDVINVAGHRLCTLALEEAVRRHPDVSDATVVGVPDEMKGEVPLALFVMRLNCERDASDISKELVDYVRESIGPVAAFRLSVAIRGLPKTRSGKIARKSIADLARGKQVKISPTIEDPTLYQDLKAALQTLGYASDAPDPI